MKILEATFTIVVFFLLVTTVIYVYNKYDIGGMIATSETKVVDKLEQWEIIDE